MLLKPVAPAQEGQAGEEGDPELLHSAVTAGMRFQSWSLNMGKSPTVAQCRLLRGRGQVRRRQSGVRRVGTAVTLRVAQHE